MPFHSNLANVNNNNSIYKNNGDKLKDCRH